MTALLVMKERLQRMPSYEYRNGRRVELEDLVVSVSQDLHETINCSLRVQAGAILSSYGTINGSIDLELGAQLHAFGPINGTLYVRDGAEVVIHRALNGSAVICSGGTLHIEQAASAMGSLQIEGTLINSGTRSDTVSGSGRILDREGSTVRRPDEIRPDGTRIFRN